MLYSSWISSFWVNNLTARLVRRLNSILVKNSSVLCGWGWYTRSSKVLPRGVFLSSVTSCLDIKANSLFSIRLFFNFSRSTWSIFSYKPSKLPNLWISCAAVFGPIPLTPGTLSLLSPISDWTSITLSGVTSNLSLTSGSRMNLSFMVSYI